MPAGFTQIELIVVVAIMAIFAALMATTYPSVRAQQKLTLAEQTLQAALRAAQQSAINEEREAGCLTEASALGTDAKKCADIGLILIPDEHNIIIFADIANPADNQFDNPALGGRDFVLRRVAFPDGVQVEPSVPRTVLIFEGAPPTIKLFSGPNEITSSVPVVLSIGQVRRNLVVGSYGQVEKP